MQVGRDIEQLAASQLIRCEGDVVLLLLRLVEPCRSTRDLRRPIDDRGERLLASRDLGNAGEKGLPVD